MSKMLYLVVQNEIFLDKVESQAKAWREIGFDVLVFNLQRRLKSFISFVRQVRDVEYVYVRFEYTVLRVWLLLLPFIYRKKIIIEIPTPLHIYFREFDYFNKYKLIILKFLYKLIFPVVARSACCIIEFGEEKSLLLENYMDKIVILENGTHDPISYQFPVGYNFNQEAILEFNNNLRFNIIIVANLTESHGVDRLLHSINIYNLAQINDKYEIILHVVGRNTKSTLKISRLIVELNLENQVIFYGHKNLHELAGIYKKANVSIATLSAFKKGMLKGAFSLKAREAALMGIPSIFDYEDIEFQNNDLGLKIPANNDNIDINNLVIQYKAILYKHKNNLPYYVHEYATTNFSWRNKFIRLCSRLNWIDN